MFRVLRAIVTVKKPPIFFIYGIIVIHFGPETGLARDSDCQIKRNVYLDMLRYTVLRYV